MAMPRRWRMLLQLEVNGIIEREAELAEEAANQARSRMTSPEFDDE